MPVRRLLTGAACAHQQRFVKMAADELDRQRQTNAHVIEAILTHVAPALGWR